MTLKTQWPWFVVALLVGTLVHLVLRSVLGSDGEAAGYTGTFGLTALAGLVLASRNNRRR